MSDLILRPSSTFRGRKGPLVLCVLDGVGLGAGDAGDAVAASRTPNLRALAAGPVVTRLLAHGTAVGLPSDDDMGNSEVGHNALGAGRVFDQGSKLVGAALADGSLFAGGAWRAVVGRVRGAGAPAGATLHFLGLLSDGNVHSQQDHLEALLRRASHEGVARVRVHVLLDGRDVGEQSALEYVDRLERVLAELSRGGADYRIASGGGRQTITMDRYEANWPMVALGWRTHVRGEGPPFPSARAAIEAARAERPAIIDQDLPPFVVAGADGAPLGPVRDGDAVVLFNFRGDRAIEISRAFDEERFDAFARGPRPDVTFAGMMLYDGDRAIPRSFLVPPPAIERTLGAYLAATRVTQLAVAETQKFGHVTYFWNGNRSGQYDPALERWVEVRSDVVPFEERPWMKAAEVTDVVLDSIAAGRERFIRTNFANGDMVGHTGNFEAVQLSVEAVDLCLGRIVRAVDAAGGVLVVTADHGNAEEMLEREPRSRAFKVDPRTGRPRPRTSHSLNPVLFAVHDAAWANEYRVRPDVQALRPGLANVAATLCGLLGYEPPADYAPSVLAFGA